MIERYVTAFLLRALAPLLAVAAVVLSVPRVAPAWEEAYGGTRGTFTMARRQCVGEPCLAHGTFAATGGSLRLDDVVLEEEGSRLSPGESAEVTYVGGKVHRPGGLDWLLAASVAALGVLGLGVWAAALRRRPQRRA